MWSGENFCCNHVELPHPGPFASRIPLQNPHWRGFEVCERNRFSSNNRKGVRHRWSARPLHLKLACRQPIKAARIAAGNENVTVERDMASRNVEKLANRLSLIEIK